jgi:methylmalonyl-CoA epimerase
MVGGGQVARHLTSVDHIAIAVEDMAPAAQFLVDVLGARMLLGGDNDVTGARVAKFACAGFNIELMQPLRATSALAAHLTRRGQGFHHLTFVVDDVAETVSDLSAVGLSAVGTDITSDRWAETFLSPRDTFGALLQFATADATFFEATDRYTLDDVLAGRVVWTDRVACLR